MRGETGWAHTKTKGKHTLPRNRGQRWLQSAATKITQEMFHKADRPAARIKTLRAANLEYLSVHLQKQLSDNELILISEQTNVSTLMFCYGKSEGSRCLIKLQGQFWDMIRGFSTLPGRKPDRALGVRREKGERLGAAVTSCQKTIHEACTYMNMIFLWCMLKKCYYLVLARTLLEKRFW